MSVDVMISYSRDTKKTVDKLADTLQKRNLSVWYDEYLHWGDDFTAEIQEKIITSSAVLVIWSKSACESDWVKGEADRARKCSKLIQAKIEDCQLPVPFNTLHCGDLASWNETPDAIEINKIIAAVSNLKSAKPESKEIDDNLAQVRGVFAKDAGIDVLQYVGKGEISNVYLGQYGTRRVSVKVISDLNLSSSDRTKLVREVELASYLSHPTFMRLSRISFLKNQCLIVKDYADGETIYLRMSQGWQFSIGRIVDIVNQLCEAVAEAHERGMQHLMITPSEIFVDTDQALRRETVRLSPVNFTYFLERLSANEKLVWKEESGPFMAPELYKSARQDSESEAAKRLINQKANQFALGMVAWTMLEGSVPIPISDRHSAFERIGEFVKLSEKFSERVRNAKWHGEAHALARIIARMVSRDPAKRWESMKQVRTLIGALAADYDADELEDIVKDIYQRICYKNVQFYSDFYGALFRRAPHLQAKFPSDMTRQHEMLKFALGQLLNYTQQQSEPTTLTQFVESHRRLGLNADDFRHFGEALIETFYAKLSKARERQWKMAALEIVIWPGIDYLVQKCTPAGNAMARKRDLPTSGLYDRRYSS
jgi:serine/threonine protein kinase